MERVVERRKKIEAGKLELAKFQRKRRKLEAENGDVSQTSNNDDPPSSPSLSKSVMNDNAHEQKNINSQPVALKEIDDWSSTDDMQALQLYGNKIEKLEEFIVEQDEIIHQLSFRLENAITSLNQFEFKDTQQEEMTKELENYKIQLQQVNEILVKQKGRNPVHNFLDSQSSINTIQDNFSQTSMDKDYPLFDSSDVDHAGSFIKNTEQVYQEETEFKNVNEVSNILPREFSKLAVEIGVQVDILELTQFHTDDVLIPNYSERTDLSFIEKVLFERYQTVILENKDLKQRLQQSDAAFFSKKTSSDWEEEIENRNEQSFANSLKRIAAINNISKVLNSLLHIVNCSSFELSNNESNQFSLHQLTTSNNNSNGIGTEAYHPIQFSESLSNNELFGSFSGDTSLEVFRNATFSENLSGVRDFLDHEMQANLLLMNSIHVEPDSMKLNIYGEGINEEIVKKQSNLCTESPFYVKQAVQEKYRFDQSIEQLNYWVKCFKEPINIQTKRLEEVLISEELTVSYPNLKLSRPIVPIIETNTYDELTETHSNSPINNFSSTELKSFVSSQFCKDMKLQFHCKFDYAEEFFNNCYQTLETNFLEKMERIENLKLRVKSIVDKLINKHKNESCNLLLSMKELEEQLRTAISNLSKCEKEKLDIQSSLSDQIVDLVAEHDEDLKNVKQNLYSSFQEKEKHLQRNHTALLNELQKQQQEKVMDMEVSLCQKTEEVKDNFTKAITSLESKHAAEMVDHQRKVKYLLKEKTILLKQSKKVYETVLKQNEESLHKLLQQMESQIYQEKEKLQLIKSGDSTMECSFTEALTAFAYNIRTSIHSLSIQKNVFADDTDVEDAILCSPEIQKISPNEQNKRIQGIKDMEREHHVDTDGQMENLKKDFEGFTENVKTFDCNHINYLIGELDNARHEFEAQNDYYRRENLKLEDELKLVHSKLLTIEDHNEQLKKQLGEAEEKLQENLNEMDRASVSNVAQTNSRLLHVLSDAVKTFLEIEQNINNRLMEFGLSTGPSHGPLQQDDDTGQSVGSREDFSGIGVNESSNLDLHEDGPDLTPRTWNLVKSMGDYDAEAEDEDIVIGTTRRVRLQVDHLLHLLSLVFDKTKEQDFKALLKRNEELSQELQEETEDRDYMQMNLVNAQSFIRKCEADKQRFEDDNFQLSADKESLSHEVTSLELQISQLGDEKERMFEEKRLMQAQLDLLASRLGDPEKMTSCNENLSCHVPELLQQNTKLSSEKLYMQKNLGREKKTLATRVQQLELTLDEMTAQRDDIIEKNRREKEDLQCQIDSLEKQLLSYKKFINEQAAEREQERDDLLKEIRKLYEQIRERDKIQSIESQHSKEAESLEHQLKTKIEEHLLMVCKKEKMERELRQSMDKIQDLREIIAELEKQLESKSRIEIDLKQKLENALKSLSDQERHAEDLKTRMNQHSNVALNDDLTETVHNLEDQLASKSQELEQLYQSEILLKELRGQLHFLEAKVDQKTRQVESMNLVSLTASPVLSDDASHCESHDGEQHQVHCEDSWEMSPRSVHWLEVRRLEEKICRLIQIEEELVKQNKDYHTQLKKLLCLEEEWCHEKAALQKQTTDQLLQITALKTQIEEIRHRAQPPVNSQALTEIENLRDALESEQEQRKKAFHEALDLKHELHELERSILDKNHLIQKLQTDSHIRQVLCNKHTQTKLKSPVEIVTSTPKSESVISTLWQNLLQEKSNQIDFLTQELEDVRSQLQQKESCIVAIDDIKVGQLYENNKEIHLKLFQTEMELSSSKEEVSCLLKRIVELENAMKKNKEELQLEQVQLEKDFDTVQDMMQKKEKELSVLQEETENQMRLEAANDTLQQQLLQQDITNGDLCERLRNFEEELAQEKLVHSLDVEEWKKKVDDLTQHYELKLDALKMQIKLLKSDFLLNEDFNDVEIREVQEKIISAAAKLQNTDQDCSSLFPEIVYRILQQAVELKTNALKSQYEIQLDDMQKTWCQKIMDTESAGKLSLYQINKDHEIERKERKEEANLAINQLQQKFDLDMKKFSEEKENFWKDKLETMEKTWVKEKEVLKYAMREEYQLNIAKKIEEIKQSCQEIHIEETCKLKEVIVKVNNEKNLNEELMKNMHEKEKLILLKECENKIISIGHQLNEKFNKERDDFVKQHSQEVAELRTLIANVEKEKDEINRKHQEELNYVRLFFSKKWVSEIQKFQQIHKGELQALKDSEEKSKDDVVQYLYSLYENKFKSIQTECEAQLIEEKQSCSQQHQEEIDRLHDKFEKQKDEAIAQREQQLKIKLQQKYDKEFLERLQVKELQKFESELKILEKTWQKKLANNEKKIKSAHQKEFENVKQNFEVQINAQRKAHEDYLVLLKEQYNGQLQAAQDVIRALKESSIAFPKSSISDIASSDDTCSSNNCKERLVIKKIQGYGKKTLALTENLSQKDKDDMIELQSLRELKSWIIEHLQDVILSVSDPQKACIKLLIEELIEEVKRARKSLQYINNYKMSLQEEIDQAQRPHILANSELQQKVDIQARRIAWLESKPPVANGNIPPDEGTRSNGNYTLESEEPNNINFSSMENARTAPFHRSDSLVEGPLIADPLLRKRQNFKKLQWSQRRDRRRIVALIFQKKYLSTLLSAFQATEEITVAMLAQMGVSISNQRSPDSSDDKPKGISLFRSVTYVIIALTRMKSLAAQWQKDLAHLSSPPSIRRATDYKSIFKNTDFMTSSTSVSTCSGEEFGSDRQPNRYKKDNSETLPSNQMIQYVNRLEELHRQLGLGDDLHS